MLGLSMNNLDGLTINTPVQSRLMKGGLYGGGCMFYRCQSVNLKDLKGLKDDAVHLCICAGGWE